MLTSANPNKVQPVSVTNFPDPQHVVGTVNVGNLPVVQQVSGAVEVSNLTACSGEVRLVGFTSATLPGNSGMFGFTQACQVEFPGSRMCTVTEAARTASIPDLSGSNGSQAWVDTDTASNSASVNCDGWTLLSSSGTAHSVTHTGQRVFSRCDTVHSVACCAPV